MVDLIIHYGALPVLIILVIFTIVFILAEPQSDISFWGIKFKKKWGRKINFYEFRPLPKRIPSNWKKVCQVFVDCDSSRISESIVNENLGAMHGLTALTVKQTCVEMKKHGLLEFGMGNYILTERALKHLNQFTSE